MADVGRARSWRMSEVAMLDDWRTILYTGVAIGLKLF